MRRVHEFLGAGLLLVFAACGWAQGGASIWGTVTEATGSAIPAASVKVKNLETGAVRNLLILKQPAARGQLGWVSAWRENPGSLEQAPLDRQTSLQALQGYRLACPF